MSGAIVQQTIVVESPQGLHLRPLTAFAQAAAGFLCDIKVSRDGRSVDGKSAWEMVSMVSMPGSVLTIQAEGEDASAAVAALVTLLDRWAKIDSEAKED
jgi:phosphocarrier protein HPr